MESDSHPKRFQVLFYCQPALGYGHYIRSLYVCKSLIKQFDVDFLLGIPPPGQTIDSPHFHLHALPPLWLSSLEVPFKLTDPYGKLTVEQVLANRKEYLKEFLKGRRYDVFFTEYFPFSKTFFKEEIFEIIHTIKAQNPKCLIICSLRDVGFPVVKEKQLEIVDIVNKYYDYIFIHSDPKIIQLHDNMPYAKIFHNKIVYTGYATDELQIKPERRTNRIVVSVGGGLFGSELMLATVKIASRLPDYQFLFILGPKSPPSLKTKLEEIAKETSASNIEITEFLPNFPQVLSESALSISLGGNMTLLDVLKTATPALAYPHGSLEQGIISKLFSVAKAVHLLEKNDLEAENLIKKIQEVLLAPYSPWSINLDGAENTLIELLKKLKSQE